MIASDDPIHVNIAVSGGLCWDSLKNWFSSWYYSETGSSYGFYVDKIGDYTDDDPSELQLTMSPCSTNMGSSEANAFCKYLSSHTWYFYVQGSSTSYMAGSAGYVNSCSLRDDGTLFVSMYYK